MSKPEAMPSPKDPKPGDLWRDENGITRVYNGIGWPVAEPKEPWWLSMFAFLGVMTILCGVLFLAFYGAWSILSLYISD